MLRSSTHQLTHKNHLAIGFTHRNIVVTNTLETLLHLVEFMVVRSKEGLGMSSLFVNILNNRPCDRNTVIGTCSASQLIKEHQTALAQVIQDTSRLVHLHHKGTFAQGNIVASTYTGKDLIYHTYASTLCWDKTTHLCHQHNQCCLTQ